MPDEQDNNQHERDQKRLNELWGGLIDLCEKLKNDSDARDRQRGDGGEEDGATGGTPALSDQTQSSNTLETVRQLQSYLSVVEQMLGQRSHLTRFFEEVGRGMVDAQRALDAQAADYNNGSPLQPSMFRIPKASADLKFSVSSLTSTSMNVFFASSKEEEERRQKHSISFDIVAAPPPADYQNLMGPLRSLLLLEPTRRGEIRDRILAHTRRRTRLRRFVQGQFERVLLFPFEEGHIAAWAEPGAATGGEQGEPREPQVMFLPAGKDTYERIMDGDPGDKAAKKRRHLALFLIEIGDRQAAALNRTRGDNGSNHA